MQKKYQETKLGKIEYTYRAGNPLVVFLNCFGSFDTAQNFLKIIKELPKDYGIFAPDYLNTGFSGETTTSYTIAEEAKELTKIINNLHANDVIMVAHSIGGAYAAHMSDKINNLRGIIGIEPTTREIILNPPQDAAYTAQQTGDPEKFIRNKISELFSSEDAETFWNTTVENSKRFDEHANQALSEAMEKDDFWNSNIKVNDNCPVIIFTQAYRQKEYERSEYLNKNPLSRVIPLGTFHYIQWEYSREIVKWVIQVVK